LPDHGKGRNVWLCLGWLHQSKSRGVTALLDCDVVNFQRGLLARLAYPLMRPDLGYQFSKGYYPRLTDRLHGRLTRLLVEPLLRAWEEIHKHAPLTSYLQSFRYALSGEMAFSAEWSAQMTFPAGYGLEIGVLGQVFDQIPRNAVCQSCLTEAHDHRHQELHGPAGTAPSGLEASALEVIATMVHLLGGKPASQSALETAYRTQVCRALHHSVTNAAINDMPYDLEAESRAARLFGKCVARSSIQELVWLPAWKDLDVTLPSN
jgi:glucosyl-3-phosphoglycerate synthase